MGTKIGINKLKLSYGPMTAYEFDEAREDIYIREVLKNTSIYIIAKRQLPFFSLKDSTEFDDKDGLKSLHLLVHYQNYNPVEIIIDICKNREWFPDGVASINMLSNKDKPHMLPRDLFQAIAFFDANEKFLLHANFDRLIQLYYNGLIDLQINGDITPIVTYEVLYVGECVKEHIFDRFEAHHALQKILLKERIIPKDYDKANDLMLLPFELSNEMISTIGDGDSDAEIDEFIRIAMGGNPISPNTVSLDCEKALINAMNPKYNRDKFKRYPYSTNGLYSHNLDSFSYLIDENLVLAYGNEQKIYGNTGKYQSVIRIDNNKDFSIETFDT